MNYKPEVNLEQLNNLVFFLYNNPLEISVFHSHLKFTVVFSLKHTIAKWHSHVEESFWPLFQKNIELLK